MIWLKNFNELEKIYAMKSGMETFQRIVKGEFPFRTNPTSLDLSMNANKEGYFGPTVVLDGDAYSNFGNDSIGTHYRLRMTIKALEEVGRRGSAKVSWGPLLQEYLSGFVKSATDDGKKDLVSALVTN